MEDKDVSKLKEKIEKVDHVKEVIWYDSIADISMPKSMLPTKVYDAFNSETGTMMAIFFDEGTSSDGTMEAISEIRSLAGEQCFLSGMSAVVTAPKELAEKETPMYVLIADGEKDSVGGGGRGGAGDDRTWSYNGIVLCTDPLHAQYWNCNCL